MHDKPQVRVTFASKLRKFDRFACRRKRIEYLPLIGESPIRDVRWISDDGVELHGNSKPPKLARNLQVCFESWPQIEEVTQQDSRVGGGLRRVARRERHSAQLCSKGCDLAAPDGREC